MTISEVARTKGVNKSVVSRKVAELEAEGLISTRSGPNRAKLINLPEFDRVAGAQTDLVKEQSAATARTMRALGEAEAGEPTSTASADGTFTEAQKRKVQYEAGLKALEYGERSEQLVAIGEVKSVIAEMSQVWVQAAEQLVLRADEIAAASLKDGPAGARVVLKAAVFNLLNSISQSMSKLEAMGRGNGDGVEVDISFPSDETAP